MAEGLKPNVFPPKEVFEPKEGISSLDIVDRVNIPEIDNMPLVILKIGTCRTGTTVHLRVFGNAGVPSFNNPIKYALQRELHNQPGDFDIPPSSVSPVIFDKESIGALTKAESLLNPVQVYRAVGVPAEKLRVIINAREPLATFASWQKAYGDRVNPQVLMKHFVLAYRNVYGRYNESLREGIHTTAFVYESLRDSAPSQVVQHLFDRLELSYTEASVSGWENRPAIGDEGSNIYFSKHPSIFTHKVGEKVHEKQQLEYVSKPVASLITSITIQQADIIERNGLYQIYNQLRILSSRDLDLPIEASTEFEDFMNAKHAV